MSVQPSMWTDFSIRSTQSGR